MIFSVPFVLKGGSRSQSSASDGSDDPSNLRRTGFGGSSCSTLRAAPAPSRGRLRACSRTPAPYRRAETSHGTPVNWCRTRPERLVLRRGRNPTVRREAMREKSRSHGCRARQGGAFLGLRHPHGPGVAGPLRRAHDDDLPARAESRRPRCPEPDGQAVGALSQWLRGANGLCRDEGDNAAEIQGNHV